MNGMRDIILSKDQENIHLKYKKIKTRRCKVNKILKIKKEKKQK